MRSTPPSPPSLSSYSISRLVPCKKFSRVLRLCILSALATVMIVVMSTYSSVFRLQDANYLGVNMCPACYGESLCEQFFSGRVRYRGWSKLHTLHNFNVKNVFYASHDDGRQLVLKKLAHDNEIEEVDRKLCRQLQASYPCQMSDSLLGVAGREATPRFPLTVSYLKQMNELMSCPSQRLIDMMVLRYQEAKLRNINKANELSDSAERLQLIYTLMINPEPIILQMFPEDGGWPFPKYHGACGRYIVEEYVGSTLADLISSNWSSRVSWAHQISRIAQHLTNNTSHFALYMTDVSLDNFAVDHKGKVKVVDVENVIAVDLEQLQHDAPKGWDVRYQSEAACEDDGECLVYSGDALCSHYWTDHNYLAVCKNVLSRLLHSMPKIVRVQWRLDQLLQECVKPSLAQESRAARVDVWAQLTNVLDKLHTLNIDISLN